MRVREGGIRISRARGACVGHEVHEAPMRGSPKAAGKITAGAKKINQPGFTIRSHCD